MFKVAKRHNLEVLEEYGFKSSGRFYFKDVNDSVRYYVTKESRKLEIEKEVELTKCDFCGKQIDVVFDGLNLFYKLIKDGILEEV